MADGFNFPILTPPFLNQGVPADPTRIVQSGDPYAELESLLNNMQNRAPIAPPQQGTLQTIINALAQGAAIAASPDPGAALGQQLQAKQARSDKFTQMNAEMQNNLQMVKLQSAIDKARSISAEQGEVRKERRQDIYNRQEEQRKLAASKELKEFDLNLGIKELQLKEDFLNASEPARMVREKNKILLEDIPKQRRDALEWEAMATALVQNADPIMAARVGKKLAGIDPVPFTTAEAAFKAQVDKARFTQAQTDLELKQANIANVKANTAYTLAGKPGSSAFQDRFGNAYNQALARDVVETLDNQYFKTPDNRILTIEEVSRLPITDPGRFSSNPLSPEENAAHVMKQVSKLKELKMQQQQGLTTIKPQDVSPKAQQVLEYARSQNYTPEQTRVLMNSNGISIEEINKIVPQGQQIPNLNQNIFANPTMQQQTIDPKILKKTQVPKR